MSRRRTRESSSDHEGEEEESGSEMSSGSAVPARKRTAGRKRKAVATYREDLKEDWESWEPVEDISRNSADSNDDTCAFCGSDSNKQQLLCCELCPSVYHLYCLQPPLKSVPSGDWFCPDCTSLLRLQNIERILAARQGGQPQELSATAAEDSDKGGKQGSGRPRKLARSAPSAAVGLETDDTGSTAAAIRNLTTTGMHGPEDAPDTQPGNLRQEEKPVFKASAAGPNELEFLVKCKELSYLHCFWVREQDMRAMAKKFPAVVGVRLRRFLEAEQAAQRAGAPADEDPLPDDASADLVDGVHPSWVRVGRILAERRDGTGKGSRREVLVKWQGLGYEEASWELDQDLLDPEAQAKIAAFKARQPIIQQSTSGPKTGKRKKKQPTLMRRSIRGNPDSSSRYFDESPEYLTGQLHPYQLEGLNWLYHAFHQGQHVILADEMGLGKTIQTIAFQATLTAEGSVHPHLVVVPLSTLPNWEREFALWAPQLNVVLFHGTQSAREVIKKHELYAPGGNGSNGQAWQARVKFHVMVTSYETALTEATELRRLRWETLVVDEGHRLKNKESRLFQVLKDVKVDQRVLLTGTPLQNNVAELFMLMHFLDNGKFDDLEKFEAEFANISHGEQVSKLHQMLGPHLLRRMKKDVLKELPPKREQIVRVELSPLQKEWYRIILTRSFPALATSGKSGTTKTINNVLMELRKCCNHPYLLKGAEAANAAAAQGGDLKALEAMVAASGKLALIDAMLAKLRAQGHRVLIYSQFTSLLDVLEDWLIGREWGFQRIDGDVGSQERQARIDRFNQHPDKYCCFLLSTRAGGLGINLATADTVIIFDSDWNPHNDLQAQARAHRLGQQRPVMVYRLVTRATIEERMMQQAKRKLVLEHLVVQKMGKSQQMRQEELDDLIRYGAAELFADAGVTPKEMEAAVEGATEAAAPSPAAVAQDVGSVEELQSGLAAGGEDAVAEGEAEAGGKEGPEAAKAKQRVAMVDMEKLAGRTGGDTGRRIIYDDAAVDRLLDRSELLNQPEEAAEEAEPQNDFMQAFKVATFDFAKDDEVAKVREEEEAEPETEKPKPKEFWEELLKPGYEQMQEAEQAALGKGKRERRQVQYNQDGTIVDEDEDEEEEPDSDFEGDGDAEQSESDDDDAPLFPHGTQKIAASASQGGHATPSSRLDDLQGGLQAVTASSQLVGSLASLIRLPAPATDFRRPSSVPLPPSVPSTSVPAARPAPASAPPISAPTDAAPIVGRKRGRPPTGRVPKDSEVPPILGFDIYDRTNFMKELMAFGLGDSKPNAQGSFNWAHIHASMPRKTPDQVAAYGQLILTQLSEPARSGDNNAIPRTATLQNNTPQQILVRMGLLHLIKQKVAATESADPNNFRPGPPGYRFSRTKVWQHNHDWLLLKGILRHGYGKWWRIATDQELGLTRVLEAETELQKELTPREAEAEKPEKREARKAALSQKRMSDFIRKRVQLLSDALHAEIRSAVPAAQNTVQSLAPPALGQRTLQAGPSGRVALSPPPVNGALPARSKAGPQQQHVPQQQQVRPQQQQVRPPQQQQVRPPQQQQVRPPQQHVPLQHHVPQQQVRPQQKQGLLTLAQQYNREAALPGSQSHYSYLPSSSGGMQAIGSPLQQQQAFQAHNPNPEMAAQGNRDLPPNNSSPPNGPANVFRRFISGNGAAAGGPRPPSYVMGVTQAGQPRPAAPNSLRFASSEIQQRAVQRMATHPQPAGVTAAPWLQPTAGQGAMPVRPTGTLAQQPGNSAQLPGPQTTPSSRGTHGGTTRLPATNAPASQGHASAAPRGQQQVPGSSAGSKGLGAGRGSLAPPMMLSQASLSAQRQVTANLAAPAARAASGGQQQLGGQRDTGALAGRQGQGGAGQQGGLQAGRNGRGAAAAPAGHPGRDAEPVTFTSGDEEDTDIILLE